MSTVALNRMTLSCVGVACLLLFFCYRLWSLGVTHHDDAIWFLASQQGNWGIIKDFAVNQGRIWAFVSGLLMYVALYLQGSVAGEAIRIGSLAIFFVIFYSVVSIYLGRRVALMAAVLNLALYAMRWEGSIVSTYPAFSWILMALFLCAVWLGWRYANNSRPFFLHTALAALFVSLFLHEGVSVLFAALFPLSVFANHYFVQRSFPSVKAVFHTVTSRRQLVGAVAVIGFYFALYLAWRLVFPTNYEGNTLGDVNIARVFPTLFGLSASGSILSDVVHPYSVNFADAVGQDGYSVTYSPLSYLRAVADSPSAFFAALIVFVVIFLIASSGDQSKRNNNIGWLTIGGIAIGALIAFVPILPVALVEKYQRHYFELGIHSYVYTALSHFGITLGIASLVLWVLSFRPAGYIYRNLLSALIALAVAVLAFCGYQMNDAIANDIRVETSRWKVVDQAMEIATQLDQPINLIYAPRLFNGSWFTVLDTSYWSQYVSVRHNKPMTFTRDPIPMPSTEHSAAYMDFTLGRNASQSIVVLAPLGIRATNDSVFANKIVVAIDRPDPSDLARYVLFFRDQQRGSVEVRFSQLDMLNKSGTIRTISNVTAYPESIRVNRYSMLKSLPVGCDKSIVSGTTVFFGTASSGEGRSCVANNWLREGWNSKEQAGVWSKEKNAVIVIPTKGLSQGALVLTLSIGTFTGLGFYDSPQSMTLRDGIRILTTRTDKKGVGFQPLRIQIPSNKWSPGKDINLSIDVDHTINPAKEKLSNDTRDLGVYIQSLKVEVVNGVAEING